MNRVDTDTQEAIPGSVRETNRGRWFANPAMRTGLALTVLISFTAIATAQPPGRGLHIELERVALRVIGPQNEFLSPEEKALAEDGMGFSENITVEKIEFVPMAAYQNEIPVFIPIRYSSSEDSGPDWLTPYKSSIKSGKTVTGSPHLGVGNFDGGSAIDLLYGLRGDGYIRLGWRIDL